MAHRPHENDISIGKDAWITFGDLAGGQESPVDIDTILEPVIPFLESLETACVSECCGIHAFLLWPEEIEKATAEYKGRELEALSSRFASVNKEIADLTSDTVVSARLNQYFRKSVFLELIAHIRKVLAGAQ